MLKVISVTLFRGAHALAAGRPTVFSTCLCVCLCSAVFASNKTPTCDNEMCVLFRWLTAKQQHQQCVDRLWVGPSTCSTHTATRHRRLFIFVFQTRARAGALDILLTHAETHKWAGKVINAAVLGHSGRLVVLDVQKMCLAKIGLQHVRCLFYSPNLIFNKTHCHTISIVCRTRTMCYVRSLSFSLTHTRARVNRELDRVARRRRRRGYTNWCAQRYRIEIAKRFNQHSGFDQLTGI